MANKADRFRLRINEKIVGFQKKVGPTVFYSRDEYAWSGKEIEYLQKDTFSGWKDVQGKALYDQDILQRLDKNEDAFFLLHWDEMLNQFQTISLDGEEALENIIVDDEMRVVVKRISYSFYQSL